MSYLIEDPSSFAPIEVWREHLRQLRERDCKTCQHRSARCPK
jgi:hypothetical protein